MNGRSSLAARAVEPEQRPDGERSVSALVPPPAWDRFVEEARGGTVFQTRGWCEARRTAGWDMRYISVAREAAGEDSRVLLACAAVGIRRVGPWALAYCQRGPVWRDSGSLVRLLERMRSVAREAGAAFLKMNPDLPGDDPDLSAFLEAGWRKVPGEAYAHRATYRVDLRASERELLAGFEGRVRRSVARARRDGVVIELGSSPSLLDRFCELVEETAERRGFPSPPRPFLREVRARLAADKRFEIRVARMGDRDVAAAVHLLHAGRCTYMWGGSTGDRSLKRSGATEALHQDALLSARSKGMLAYDLHGVPLDRTGNPFGGLALFKGGFGGELVRLAGDLDLPLRPCLYQAWRRLEPLYLRAKGVRLGAGA